MNCGAILPILWAESLVDNELLIVVVLFNDSEMSFVGNTDPIRRACGNVFGLFWIVLYSIVCVVDVLFLWEVLDGNVVPYVHKCKFPML